MTLKNRWRIRLVIAAVAALATGTPQTSVAQRGGGANADANLPDSPTAVPLPEISGPITGPGPIFESVQSLPPGMGLAHYGYQATEYFVTGEADGQAYTTRIVVRKPADNADFSGFVLAEAMHPSGSTHLFEFTSHYLMSSGHASVEIVTGALGQFTEHNNARYGKLAIAPGQVNEVLAQVGALMKSDEPGNPMSNVDVRKMVLAGTSATAGILIRYLPAHMVYKTQEMANIYDGFLPHSTGATVRAVNVPLIQVPTMTEVISGTATARQDGDEAGQQYRLYEFAGMAHVDTRDSVRFKPDPCGYPVSTFPLQAYVSVALNHLFSWIDNGTVPPRSPRILVDRSVDNDGSVMALDEHGNAIGGIRNPYVDVPTTKLSVRNIAAETLPANPSAYIAASGLAGANQMCSLGGYELAMSRDQLRQLHGTADTYRNKVRARLDQLEAAGWSLPVYREMILSDAARVDF